MATRRRRWPDGANEQRRDAIAAAQEIRKLARKIRAQALLDPRLVELMAADIETQAADIERLLILARYNSYEAEDDV